MKKINIFCFGFGQVAKNFVKKLASEGIKVNLNATSRKKTQQKSIYNIDYNIFQFDQNNFDKRNKHPFDAEALIATKKSLILISKNRKKLTTELYSFPKKAGNYSLSPQKSFDIQSLITGGDYHEKLELVALVGYTKSREQFLYTLSYFDMDNLNSVKIKKFKLPLDGKQIEAVKIIDHNTFWITSEDEGNSFPMLYKIQI